MTRWKVLVRVGRWLLALAVVTFAARALADQWAGVTDHVDELSLVHVVLAGLAAAGGLIASMVAWRVVLADLGSPLSIGQSFHLYFVGQLAKYVPGGVWGMVAQMEIGRRYAIPRARSVVALAVTLVLAVATGAATTIATLPLVSRSPVGRYVWLVLVLPAFALLHPRVLPRVVGVILRVTRRQAHDVRLNSRRIGVAVLWMFANWVMNGLHTWLLVRDLGSSSSELLLRSTGAFALAWTLGFLTVIVPMGLGVREAAIAGVLGPAIGVPKAAIVALASRLLLTIADVVLALIAGATLQRRRVATVAGAPSPSTDLPGADDG